MRSVRAAFTLIELIVVLGIIVAAMGLLVTAFPRSDRRLQEVKVAAEELAATCRQARALALSKGSAHAVVFHIQNAPTSSGRVLNNRTGGHWYRIVGPATSIGSSTAGSRSAFMPDRVDNLPPVVGSLNGRNSRIIISTPFNLAQMAGILSSAWVGEQHVLPAGKVRFLALTDMDYGDFSSVATRRVPSTTVSYPRPWFGWWDEDDAAGGGAGRLYPWGGYDPAIPGSGFYYWGSPAASAFSRIDPQPVQSTNAVARALDHWIDGQQAGDSGGNSTLELPEIPGGDHLYEAGAPRPLINGSWRDMSIVFSPTGEAFWGGTLPGRRCDRYKDGVVEGVQVFRGATERCNGSFNAYGMVDQHTQAETGNFERDSGGFFITLGPDARTDDDVFPTAQAAQDSLMPAFRVFVSVLGDIRVIPVGRLAKDTGGLAPFPASEAWWRGGTNMKLYFGQDRLVTGSRLDTSGTGIGDTAVGRPITDFLTPGMLANRSVWLK